MRGIPRREVLAKLREHGVSALEAQLRVTEIERSPAFAVARRFARRVGQLEKLADLQADLVRRAAHPADVERRPFPPADEFFDRYYATNTPAVFTDLVPRWPAAKWTPALLRERFGHVEIQMTADREADPDHDINFRRHGRAITMAHYVDSVLAAGASNDVYLIANNRNLELEGLRPLFDDVDLPDDVFDPNQIIGSSALWFGPAGTVTRLHHDTSNILFCQLYGRKRLRLVSPLERSALEGARGVYSIVDAENPDLDRSPDFADAAVKVVELAPGDALFIPVGWWHHVRALDVSISLAVNNFRRPNRYEWYKPGAVR